jgi:hypothetical protein
MVVSSILRAAGVPVLRYGLGLLLAATVADRALGVSPVDLVRNVSPVAGELVRPFWVLWQDILAALTPAVVAL